MDAGEPRPNQIQHLPEAIQARLELLRVFIARVPVRSLLAREDQRVAQSQWVHSVPVRFKEYLRVFAVWQEFCAAAESIPLRLQRIDAAEAGRGGEVYRGVPGVEQGQPQPVWVSSALHMAGKLPETRERDSGDVWDRVHKMHLPSAFRRWRIREHAHAQQRGFTFESANGGMLVSPTTSRADLQPECGSEAAS